MTEIPPARPVGAPVDASPPVKGRRAKRAKAPVWRERLVPKTVIGISTLILAFAVGSAFSGVCFYAYYQQRLDANEKFNTDFASKFGAQFDNATKTIAADQNNARAAIQDELEPLKRLQAGGDVIGNIIKTIAPSVWFVQTTDEQGAASVGSAFAVAGDDTQTLFLTSYTSIKAASRVPGPQVTLRKGDQQVKVTVWTWQEDKDLALLIAPKINVPKLAFAPANQPLRLGERLFAVSGLGGSGGAVTQGFVADVSAAGVQHDAAIGQGFQGGPLVNTDGKVVAIASRSYSPLGYRSDEVWFGVPPKAACEKVLKCPNGDPATAAAGVKG